jgi:hypothetical protein
MAITTCLTNQFKLDILKGGIRFGGTATDTFKVALYTSSATLDATTTAYSATNEISGTGYSAGGTAVVPTLSAAGTTTYIDFTDAQWTTATFTARGMMLYRSGAGGGGNGTTTDLAIGIWDFGSDKSVSAGTFTIVMPAADTSNALIRLS